MDEIIQKIKTSAAWFLGVVAVLLVILLTICVAVDKKATFRVINDVQHALGDLAGTILGVILIVGLIIYIIKPKPPTGPAAPRTP